VGWPSSLAEWRALCCNTGSTTGDFMNKILIMAAFGLVFAVSAQAADNKQQTKMAQCNQEAGDKKGDERKAFMKTCLSAKKETPQQAKMKTCNVEAKDMKGDARKKFMSECLKKG
jgi:psiF repeat-containing protein